MQTSRPLCALILALLMCESAFARPEYGHGHGGGYNHHRSRRSLYKKSTHKSNAIGEYSNANIRKFQAQLKGTEVSSQSRFLSTPEIPESCVNRQKSCDVSSKFRTLDGTCNNLQNPFWGAAFTQLKRLMTPAYHDGFNEPRGGINSILPNAREISTTIHPDLIEPDLKLTNMVPQFGQFIDHDMTFAPEADHRCCTTNKVHDDCWDISIPTNDNFYSKFNQTCMDFTRSTAYCFPANGAGVREQMNSLTSFLDASQVYGSDAQRGDYLREHSGGGLRANSSNPNWLPSVESIEHEIGKEIEIEGVYAAGDDRVNEMPGLTVMHTLLFREHNRLANQIQRLQPLWDDERIYQNARRILIAEWQHVVYGEYLPVILGPQTMARYSLSVEPAHQSSYDPLVDPSIIQSFAAAAYRFGHTLINGLIRMYRESAIIDTYQVRNGFFNDGIITSHDGQGYDLILNGLMQQNAQTYDRFVTEDLTNFLLREPHDSFGADLIARNIQRARDHGLPPYTAYRRLCNLPALTTWDRRPAEIPAEAWEKLQKVYKSTTEIDLFPGGLSETPVADGVTGPTFNCIKALQFYNVKYGDRFFYTHRSQAASFTVEQIAKINERTWGDIICQNSALTRTPRNVFRPASSSNPWIPCSDPSRNFDISDLLL